jgi:hypothetical protein
MRNHVRLNWVAPFCAILGAAVCSPFAAASDATGRFVRVESVTSLRTGDFLRVTAQLVNTSELVITGYTLVATVTYGNGQQKQGMVRTDMAWVLVNEKMGYPPPRDEMFGPGQVKASSIDVPVGDGTESSSGISPALRVSAVVTMVAFADKTAVGPEAEIAALVRMRVQGADEAGDLATDLATLREAKDTRAALGDLMAKARSAKWAATAGGRDQQAAERRLSAMQRYAAPAAEHPEALPLAIKAWQMRNDLLREHSSLRRLEEGEEKREGGR